MGFYLAKPNLDEFDDDDNDDRDPFDGGDEE